MLVFAYARSRIGRIFMILTGLVASCAIILLGLNVAQDIDRLGSARSDNVQWTLAQTNVEFLELKTKVDDPSVDLAELRQRYDVFYSRINTVRRATVFQDLRANPASQVHLDVILDFLDESVPLIDAEDSTLRASLPQLVEMTDMVRPEVRALANSGLKLFARSADAQRAAVANTLTKLAAALVVLIGVLAFIIIHLNFLNRRIYRREREKNQTAKRMEAVMGTSLDGVIVSDATGRIVQFSAAAEVIFGHKKEDVVGKDIGEVIVPDHMRDAHDAGMERMRNNGEKRVVGKGRVQLEAKRKNGEIFPVELAIQSAQTDRGEILIAFLRDISARVAAEAELVAARDRALAGEKLKTDFLSTMSHEIRTPLNGLLGNMNLLRDTNLDPDQDRYVGHMETSGRLLMSHISDVLDITRYDAGKLSTRSEPMNISALLQDIVDNQSGAASKNETSLQWQWIGTKVHWVLSDHDRLQHVMMNVIGNAVKFTKRGKVSVRIENIGTVEAPELRIEIQDTGPGISEDLAKHMFDDFVTGNTAYDRDVGGTGLGLSIAKRFVTALGGKIGVESVLGEGTTFWITLPVTETAPVEDMHHAPLAEQHTQSLNVLLVEDNEINRIVAREMLQSEGHTVTEAHNGLQGADLANAHRFDLILMDISMPVMDGRTSTRRIRTEGGASAKSPIIAVTANAMAEEQAEFIKDGMDNILTKPVSRDALRKLLQATNVPIEEDTSVLLVNHNHSAEAREALGEETFAKLRSRFIAEVDSLIAWLNSQEEKDFLEIASRTHTVAGSAAVFGTDQTRNVLKEIENAAKIGDVAEIRKLELSLQPIWKATKAMLLN